MKNIDFEVPAVRVRYYNENTNEHEDGTVIDSNRKKYLVIPDYDLNLLILWDKDKCDVLR